MELKKDQEKERYIPISNDPQEKANAFIKLFKSMRVEQEKLKSNENILLLQFEDLCINYEETLRKYMIFYKLMKKIILIKKNTLIQMIR